MNQKGNNGVVWSYLFIFLINLFIPSQQQTQTKPHIIFILADDMGWNDVGFHGSNVMPTPNIDALAYSGVILHEYYVTPLCSPTRAALLTARHPIRTGMWERVMNASEPFGVGLEEKFLPQYLKEYGYSTKMVGKWHVGSHKRAYLPTSRGFDYYYGHWNSRIDYWTYRHQDTECLIGLDLHEGSSPVLNVKNEYVTRLYTRKSVDIIEKHDPSTPLFLYLSHAAVHIANHCAPLQAPQATIDKFSHVQPLARRVFAAMASELDNSVGTVVEALQTKDMLKNTIIVFSTDNGGATGGFAANPGNNWPLRSGKGTFWQGGVRAVGFVWSPLLKNAPRVSKQLMHVQDWLPTLLGSFNESPKGNVYKLDGVNGWNGLNDPSVTIREEILDIIDAKDNFASIRRQNWKLTIGSPTYGMADGWYKFGEREGTYNIAAVRNSTVAKAFAKIGKPIPTDTKIKQLRAEATLGPCPNVTTNPCKTNTTPCLFDLEMDPCEQNDVAAGQPNVFNHLIDLLEGHKAEMVASRALDRDAKAAPANWNNIWVPWGDY